MMRDPPRPAPAAAGPDVWQRHPLDVDAADAQVAQSMALLEGATAGPALRWYWADRPTLILGVFQPPELINQAACAARAIPIVRRRSGGTGVLAGPPLLSLDIALPPGHRLAAPDVTESYRWLGEAWRATLQALGVGHTRLIPIAEVRATAQRPLRRLPPADQRLSDEELAQLACFGTVSPYEVAIGPRKLVGLAQVRRRSGVLFQVGLPLTWQAELLAELLAARPDDRARLAGLLRARAIGLDALLPAVPPPAAIMAAFEQVLTGDWAVQIQPVPADAGGAALVDTLGRNPYNG
ncbi:MAG TPA: ligase [Chloroflexia bacterium]|nr:ligase [Chloroflexia bacterium]